MRVYPFILHSLHDTEERRYVFLPVHIDVSAACRQQYHGDWQDMFASRMVLQIYQTRILLPECYLSILIKAFNLDVRMPSCAVSVLWSCFWSYR